MWALMLQRFAILCVALLLISVLAFLLPYMSAGDPVRAIVIAQTGNPAIDPTAVAAMRIHLGLDRPLVVQYGSWLWHALHGDFGYSFTNGAPVAQEIGRSLTVSLELALTALGAALVFAIPLGTMAAVRPGGFLDSSLTLIAQAFVATPEFWFAPIAILVFSLYLGVLPSAGWDRPTSLVLPALVLALRPLAYFTRTMRAAMIDVLQAPYITAARSRGLGTRQTIVRHGIRNGTLPVITLFALWLAGLLGGSVVVEVIFAVPGMGRLIYNAAVNKDIPVLQASFVCIVAVSVLINTLTDLVYILLNPLFRIRRHAG